MKQIDELVLSDGEFVKRPRLEVEFPLHSRLKIPKRCFYMVREEVEKGVLSAKKW